MKRFVFNALKQQLLQKLFFSLKIFINIIKTYQEENLEKKIKSNFKNFR